MAKLSKEQKKEIINFILGVVVIYVALLFFLPITNSTEFKEFVRSLGIFAPVVTIIYVVISHVFAPLSGFPAVLLAISIFGFVKASIYLYIADMISAVINFYISRKFGRKWVTRLVGKSAMRRVDEFVETEGTEVLVIGRVFGGVLFEFVSYAAGLTNISFKKYFYITMFFNLIPTLTFILLFKNVDFSSQEGYIVLYASAILSVMIFTFFIRKYLKKKNSH